MKHTFIADTHTLTDGLAIDTDYLHICGDVMDTGHDPQELIDFVDWLDKQTIREDTILIPGNHDWLFQTDEAHARAIVEPFATVLIDQETEADGYIVYGTPWQPEFNNWAFNLPRYSAELTQKWLDVPSDTGILLTHCPPNLVLDKKLGDYSLWREVTDRIKPNVHAFGHIHETYGLHLEARTLFINCTICNERYNPINKPVEVYL